MTPRSGIPIILKAIIVNVFIVGGLVMVQRSGKLTSAMIGFYAFFFIAANTLMYFSGRARRRLQNR